MNLIELDNVSRTFTVRTRVGRLRRERREVRAVQGLSFTVAPGECVGYIGPNGAGKSTTIKMLTGILVPSGGRLRVAGVDPARERARLARRIGVVFGQRTTLWWDLPLRDSFELVRRLYRVPPLATGPTWPAASNCCAWATCWTPRCASSRSASGCAATWPPPCCTTPRCSTWTSRPSAWTC